MTLAFQARLKNCLGGHGLRDQFASHVTKTISRMRAAYKGWWYTTFFHKDSRSNVKERNSFFSFAYFKGNRANYKFFRFIRLVKWKILCSFWIINGWNSWCIWTRKQFMALDLSQYFTFLDAQKRWYALGREQRIHKGRYSAYEKGKIPPKGEFSRNRGRVFSGINAKVETWKQIIRFRPLRHKGQDL